MRRSDINTILKKAEDFIKAQGFFLPDFAFFTEETWMRKKDEYSEVLDLNLGWDITDFGLDNFLETGLTLFTLRNGIYKSPDYQKPYAEKIIVVEENQITPYHFHWYKMEDLINRSGAELVLNCLQSDENENPSELPVSVSCDGKTKELKAGEDLILTPGQSITMPQKIYHKFTARGGRVLLGEISMCNDDANDNRFLENLGRFPAIIEDEKPYRLLVSDYKRLRA